MNKCIPAPETQFSAVDRTSENLKTSTRNRQDSALILIADDDRFTRMLLRQIIEEEGYRVAEAANGQECLAAYIQLQPDMVLLDAMMPVMDGFMCCSHLQAHAGSDRIPVLMITGLNDQASVDWAFEAGATDFVTKPIHPAVLRRRVRRLIEASWAQKALRESEIKYRSVVENVKEVIFQTNCGGDWIFLNPAWTTLTGFTIEDSLGTNFFNYVHSDDQQLHQNLWQALLKGENESFRQELRYVTKGGESRWVEIHAHSTLVTDNCITGLSGTMQDITRRRQAEALETEKRKLEREILERRRAEEMIRISLEKEKEVSELKSRIISTISHEFRTPLTTILSSAELLKNYGLEWSQEKKIKHFQRIATSVEHMTRLLDDVILIGQVECEQLQFSPNALNVEVTIRQIIEGLQYYFESYPTEDKTSIPTMIFSSRGTHTQANLDEKLLQQMLANLISNAVKFSEGESKIHCDLVCQQYQVIVRVRDEGIGIPAKELERVFESFYRASNVGTIPGTGLGLTIVKKCVELQGGKITIESQLEKGTTFTVTLPLN